MPCDLLAGNLAPMLRHLAAIAVACSLLFPAYAAPSALSATDKQHAKQAFQYADQRAWHNAVLHSMQAKHPALRDIITWMALQDEGSGYDFSAYRDFLARNPGWPKQKQLQIRAEAVLFESPNTIGTKAIQQWFATSPPITGKGKVVYASIVEDRDPKGALIRDAWINGDFDAAQEKRLLGQNNDRLNAATHFARLDRLLWERKTAAAKRMLPYVTPAQRTLANARIKLQSNSRNASLAISQVPARLKADPGLMHDRMQWRARRKMHEGVREMLFKAPHTVPYPEKWWPTRRYQIREALERGNHNLAMKLLQNHGQTEGIGRAEALWLMGWINLTYLQRADQAVISFKTMEEGVSYPVSIARAAYWLGRAYDASGNRTAALEAYKRGAAFYTTFYGQLAALRVQEHPSIRLPRQIKTTRAQKKEFARDPRVQAVYILTQMERFDTAKTFIYGMIEQTESPSMMQKIAALGTEIGRTDYGVQASKNAMKTHTVLPKSSYPYYKLPFNAPIEEALIWAITRQESLFNLSAKSRAGARGLMQLMPATARGMARKLGQSYSKARLENAVYNLRLGSHYLREMIDSFDGSYVLAIAAYNAGPGRVRQWVQIYGEPGNTPEAVINWIERIPYKETRNYVQRVLENAQVYRAILNNKDGRYIKLDKDLLR